MIKIRPHRPEDLITKITSVSPDWNCPIPLWNAFLKRIMADDMELIAYLQRMCGYFLTGLTREHVLFFAYGTGANGKTTFIDTITYIMGDYAKTAPVETFTESHNDRHPTELAMLAGARLVVAAETQTGRRWDESKIKKLTGGDRVAARFMRQDFFEFTPQFKLFIYGNHKPGLRSADEAMRRRIHLIPFTVKIPEHERDKSLPEKLKAEAPGILAWMMDGCSLWQKEGLNPPAAVRDATAEYLESEDSLGLWLNERIIEDTKASPWPWTSCEDLFSDWKFWAEKNNLQPGGGIKFTRDLKSREDFNGVYIKNARWGFKGIRFKTLEDITREEAEAKAKTEAVTEAEDIPF
jgi:putative DNA primase/helicase